MAVKSTFGIVDLLVITATVATYLGLRASTVRFADEFFVSFSPFVIAYILALYAAFRRFRYASIYGVTFTSALVTSTAWAIEKVNRLPGTSFMHNDFAYENDPEINAVVVIATTFIATLICGSIGAICRYFAYRRPTT